MRPSFILAASLVFLILPVAADGPTDNLPENVRRVPPQGIEVPPEDRSALEAQIAELTNRIRQFPAKNVLAPLLPDVEVLVRAVADPLKHQEIQKPQEIPQAYELLELARERLASLEAGEAPWTLQTGLVVRGFRSKLDGSVQPYGLVIPESYSFEGAARHRLDFWFHGRGEKVTELGFIQQRLKSPGIYQPRDTIVLHPYARYSNGNKFAGEIDCLEALEHVQLNYRIDEDRILVRGFSMGGAACWNFAVHYADRWCAANPGAGFSETPEFLKSFQGETLNPTWYQRKLWRLYDCTDVAVNIFNIPTVAYSGEIDRQKQAADIMAAKMKERSLHLTHIIGPDTAHKIHPDSQLEIERRLDAIAKIGRNPLPSAVKLKTYTLRYNRMHWFTIDRIAEHWEPAEIHAVIDPRSGITTILKTDGVTAFTIDLPAGSIELPPAWQPKIRFGLGIKTKELVGPWVGSDRSFRVHLQKTGDAWEIVDQPGGNERGLVKRHGLQGPIDDAFMDSFLFVKPSGAPQHQAVGEFVDREFNHAKTHWRQQFRGDARIKQDTEVTAEDIAQHHLVLWGDPSSNALLAKIVDQLPIGWTAESITVGQQTFSAQDHALLLIYPNPLNPDRYVVLNSGFTYREYDYLNNARQVPKLPDWAIIDTRTPMTSQGPGKVVAADFFNEKWQLKRPSPEESAKTAKD